MNICKKEIRQTIQAKRRNLSAQTLNYAAEAVSHRFHHHDFFKSITSLAGYVAHEGELSLSPLFRHAFERGITCYLPCIQETGTLVFREYQQNADLVLNKYGIQEPNAQQQTIHSLHELDCVLVPLVGLDYQGHRLGMGKGFYDKTFANFTHSPRPAKPALIGICYDFQLLHKIPTATHDITMDFAITETKFLNFCLPR